MKTIESGVFRAVVLATVFSLATSDAQGQISRSSSNPYSPSGGTQSSATGLSFLGYSSRMGTRIVYGPYGGIPRTVSYNYPGFQIVIDFEHARASYGFGQSMLSSGYTYGGAGSAPRTSRTGGSAAPQIPQSGKSFDKWAVDLQRQGRPDEIQRQQKLEELRRSLAGNSTFEITSGQALNSLIESLQSNPEKLKASNPVALDAGLVKSMNFTRGRGSIGLLRNQGKIAWPAKLLDLTPADEVAKVRGQIETRFLDSFTLVNGGGKADPDTMKALLKSVDQLSDMASARASTMTFAEQLEVKRYLRSLEDSINFMKQPDASEWMPGKHKAKSKTIQELVQVMGERGVRFAPALVGSDDAYMNMHRILVRLHLEVAP